MRLHRLPCAIHPSNHVLAQELSLAAALTAEQPTPSQPSAAGVTREVFTCATAAVARESVSMEEALAFSKGTEWTASNVFWHQVEAPAEQLLRSRLQRQRQWHQRHLVASMGGGGSRPPSHTALGALLEGVADTRFIPPARLLALHGPTALLPALPQYLCDPISYEAALRHAALLAAHFTPQGLRVALTGAFRRGAPLAPKAEFLITFREERLASLWTTAETACRDACWSGPSFSSYAPNSTAAAASANALRTVPIFAEEKLGRVCERAIEGLIRCGYVVSGHKLRSGGRATRTHRPVDGLGNTSLEFVVRQWSDEAFVRHTHAFREGRKVETTAFATQGRSESAWLETFVFQPPPHHLTTPAELLSVCLHSILLHFTPAATFHVQQLFRTGPAHFTALMALQALSVGKGLYGNGIFQQNKTAKVSTESHTPRGSSRGVRIEVQSEHDIFLHAGMPYIHPVNRGIYCQLHNARTVDP